jgi:hypothetical protein
MPKLFASRLANSTASTLRRPSQSTPIAIITARLVITPSSRAVESGSLMPDPHIAPDEFEAYLLARDLASGVAEWTKRHIAECEACARLGERVDKIVAAIREGLKSRGASVN